MLALFEFYASWPYCWAPIIFRMNIRLSSDRLDLLPFMAVATPTCASL
jgi:hypothetical protein